MSHRHPARANRLALTLLGAAAIFSASAASHAAAEVATMTSHGSAISWHPSGPYDGASLTVSGPGGIDSYKFTANDQISISAPGTDGGYTYELVLTPMVPPGLRAQMEEHRQLHPGKKFAGAMKGGIQSGSFSIANGSVVDGSKAE